MTEVRKSVVIDRPAADVAAQFADVAHHQRTSVHRGVTFRVIAEADDWCDYEQRSRIGPLAIRQRYRLDRRDPRHQTNTITEGMFKGGTLVFDIAPNGPTTSEVTATLTAPSSVITRVLGPALRRALGRSLAGALTEDKADLETGRYPGSVR